MQRADMAGSTRAPGSSPGKIDEFSGSRRALMAGAIALTLAGAAPAKGTHLVSTLSPATSRAAWERLSAACDQAHAAARAAGWSDAALDAATDAEAALMRHPAPDHAALLHKLERLLEIEPDGATSGWDGAYIAQTLADMRRLLGGRA